MIRGGSITVSKLTFAVTLGLFVDYLFGPSGFWGLTGLAVIAAVSNSNGGLYAALVDEFGDEKDIGAISVISINDGPFFTMLALGAAGMASIPIVTLTAVLIPLILGMIIGNLDEEMRKLLIGGGALLIPFFAFSLGAGIDLSLLLKAGLPGVLLGLVTTFIGGLINIKAGRFAGGNGIAGAAASSTAGNAVATPTAIALADPNMAEIATQAAPFIAASVITTAVCTPILTSWINKKNKETKTPELEEIQI